MFIGRILEGNKKLRGDTLVEVLISIAIVGAVIAGAYALASHSLAEGVSATEHSQAIKIAESQVESLKSRQKDASGRPDLWVGSFAPGNPISNATLNSLSNFCLNTSASGITDPNWAPIKNGKPTNGLFTSNNLKATNPTQNDTYNVNCTDTKVAATAKYFINIKILPNAPTTPSYLVTVKWTPAGGGPTSQSQLYYRF